MAFQYAHRVRNATDDTVGAEEAEGFSLPLYFVACSSP
jgi:hypothetical protein